MTTSPCIGVPNHFSNGWVLRTQLLGTLALEPKWRTGINVPERLILCHGKNAALVNPQNGLALYITMRCSVPEHPPVAQEL